jgi:RNA polymerase sigma factor (sigma-70 family)
MTPDSELLGRYARTRSEDAFAELVRRHVNLVYSAALRQVNGDAHLAQDVAQAVFTDLARKAGSLARRESLAGWLYTSAHFAAAKIARTENRRRDREQKFMREPANESSAGVSPAQTSPEADWEKIRPALDDAMHALKENDREAILLRYFENRPFAEVGVKLGLNENAARMRVERALEKLRAVFTKHGITTATALASVLSANAVQMAPAGLAATLATASLAAAGTGTAFAILKIMTATQLKLGIGALVVAGAATAMVVQHQSQTRLRDENESLHQKVTQLQANNESLSNRLTSVDQAKSLTDEQMNELLRLRGEVGRLREQTNDIEEVQAENRRLHAQIAAENQSEISQDDRFQIRKLHVQDAATAILTAMKNYALDHNGQYPVNFGQLEASSDALAIKFPSDVRLEDFEFMNEGAVDPQGLKLIFRSRSPIQDPEGKQIWIYGGINSNGVPVTEITAGSYESSDSRSGQNLPATTQ